MVFIVLLLGDLLFYGILPYEWRLWHPFFSVYSIVTAILTMRLCGLLSQKLGRSGSGIVAALFMIAFYPIVLCFGVIWNHWLYNVCIYAGIDAHCDDPYLRDRLNPISDYYFGYLILITPVAMIATGVGEFVFGWIAWYEKRVLQKKMTKEGDAA